MTLVHTALMPIPEMKMPEYVVTWTEVVHYTNTVEADDEEQAAEMATMFGDAKEYAGSIVAGSMTVVEVTDAG